VVTEGQRSAEERGADEREIRALVEAYATAADAGDGASFGALFLPESRLTTWPPDGSPGSPRFGPRQIGAIPGVLTRRYERTSHRLGDLHVVVAGDGRTALGNLDCEAHHEAGGVDRVLTIRYEDAYRRDESGRWRFCTRDVRVVSVEERPLAG
jgi:ketosteroid isomerase-like protein